MATKHKVWSKIRDKHKEPVIRAFVALYGETHTGASALLVAGFLHPKSSAPDLSKKSTRTMNNKKLWSVVLYVGIILLLYFVFGEKFLVGGLTGLFGVFLMWLFLPQTKEHSGKMETSHTANKISSHFFSSKLKWVFLGLVVIILAGFAWLHYDGDQKERWGCLKDINYRGNSIYRLDNTNKNFHTQDEALEYCLLMKKNAIPTKGKYTIEDLFPQEKQGITWDTLETPNNSAQ